MKGPAGILALIVVLAAGYTARTWFRDYVGAMTGSKGPTCLELAGNTTAEEEGRTYIIGSVRNNCTRGFGQVTINFKLDRTPGPGVDLPQAVIYAYARDVNAGETRRFKSYLPIPKKATYRFEGFNAY